MVKNNTIKKQIVFLLMLIALFIPSVYALQVDLLDTDPSPAVAGEYIDITLRLTNPNNADDITKELSFGIKETEQILVLGENPKKIGLLQKGSSVSRTFRVYINDNLPQGNIDIETIAYLGNEKLTFMDNLYVQESDSKPELLIGNIKTTPKELLPDTDDNMLTLNLLNLGDKDADLVTAEIQVDNKKVKPSYSYSLKDSVASIDSGSEKELTFALDLEKDAKGQIPATLKTTYRIEQGGGSTYETENKIIPFTIDLIDSPYLEVTNIEQEKTFVAGSTENEFVLSITNIGDAKAEEVRVRLIPDISYPFSFEQLTEYVASKIEPGETIDVAFTTEIFDDGETKEYSITTRLESLVGDTRYSQDSSITIAVESAEKLSTSQIAIFIVIGILIVAIIFGILGRRNK